MLGPLARSRALVGLTALATLAAAGVAFASGTSATAPGSPGATGTAPFVGPVAVRVAPAPLVRTDGPLLPGLVAPDRLSRVHRPMGPLVTTGPAAEPGEEPLEVGPDSPVAEVRALQRQLNARGAQLRVDGAWGPATEAAVRRFSTVWTSSGENYTVVTSALSATGWTGRSRR